MSSYSNPLSQSKCYNAQDIGNGTITKKVRPPRGKSRGRVAGIHAFASETFTQTTTPAYIQVGVTGDLDKFASLNCGATASGATLSDSDVANTLVNDGQFDLSQEAVDELTITMVAPTGGTPAGIADVEVDLEWF